ncbi:GtrA family protein [Comamonas denitrificans]|uniref:GtrA family protein n=1 Tax=Comamonas denitrificans TaxID=117506 RepID=UPI00361A9644
MKNNKKMSFNISKIINTNVGKNSLLANELARYFLVSLIGLLIDLSLFSVAMRLGGASWFFAAILGFSAGVASVWWLSILFVFKNRSLGQSPAIEFVSFLFIGILGLGVTESVLLVGIEVLKIQPELSKISAAGGTFVFNFALRKLLLFRNGT